MGDYEKPGNSQYYHRESMDTLKSNSGSSWESDIGDSLGSAVYMQQLNSLTMDRVNIAEKKLKKNA